MAENFNSEEFKKQREEIEKIVEIQKKLNEGNMGLLEVLKDISRYDKLIADQKKKQQRYMDLEANIKKRIAKLQAQSVKEGSIEEEQLVSKIINLEAELGLAVATRKAHGETLNQHKIANRLLREQVGEARTLSNLIGKSVNKALKKGVDIAKKGLSVYVEQDEAVRNAAKSMGVLNKQADAFANNIYKASVNTNQLGIQAKDLAKMQGVYSNEIGRSVILSEEGLNAMAEMAAGTMLGADGAAMMAANMENFGLSATMSRDILQETVDLAHTMGVSSEAAINNLSKNLKLAQGYNFKKGVKGIAEMSIKAAKMKISMESVASIADKLIDVEGAVNMAAQLQVLGGEWSKMADPFKLMYQARNDIEGLQTSLANAVKSTAQFNKKTGEFDISAMEMHRLRKVAEQLGVDYKELAVAGKEAAKFSKIRGEISMDVADKTTKEFIESTASFNKDKQGYEIMVNGNMKLLKTLDSVDATTLKGIANSQEGLAQRAKDGRTFDKKMGDIMNTFKSVLLPLVRGIDSGIREPLEAFMKDPKFKEFVADMFEFGKNIGETIGGFIKEWPKLSAGIAAGVGLLMGPGAWLANGVSLGMGFNSVAGGGGGGLFGGGKGKSLGGQGFGKDYKAMRGMGGSRFASMREAGKINKMSGGAKLGAGLALGAGGMGLDMWRNSLSDRESGAGKAMGIGSAALTGAGMGMMLGPWGALAGGLIGGAYGAYNEYGREKPKSSMSNVQQDFVMRPGEGAVPFSSSDTLVGAKSGGPIDKMLDSAGGSSGEVSVNFNQPLVIKGEITLNSSNSSENIKLDDPILMREIASIVQQELRKSIGGGKLNPNPV